MMKDPIILQTLGVSHLPLNMIIMAGLSTTTLSLNHDVILNCDKKTAEIINKIGFNHIQILNNVERVDSFVAKFDTIRLFKDKNFIQTDVDLWTTEKISFDDNDIIVEDVEFEPYNFDYDSPNFEYYFSNSFIKDYKNVCESFPIREDDNMIRNYNHSIFGCRNKELLNEWLENERMHTEINNIDYDYPRRDFVYYIVVEQHHFYTISKKYDVKVKVYENFYKHYKGDQKHTRKYKNNMIMLLKYYNLNLYNRIIDYCKSSEFIQNIADIDFKLKTNCFDDINRKRYVGTKLITHETCKWHFNNIEIEEDNTEFKFYEKEREWDGYVLGENEINIKTTNCKILHPHIKYQDYNNNSLVIAKKGIYNFELTYNPADLYFQLDVFKD